MNKRLKNILLLMVLCVLVIVGLPIDIHAQIEPTPEASDTPTPFVMGSLFVEDTCTPPCFIGILPGVSTTEDVESILNSLHEIILRWDNDFLSNVFDPETGYVQDGQINFYWHDFWREDVIQANSAVSIENGVVSWIEVQANRMIGLNTVLYLMGTPDVVQFQQGPYSVYFLDLIYIQPRMQISLVSNDHCLVAQLRESFWLDQVSYYSVEKANEPIFENEMYQPRLLYFSPFEKNVPLDIWRSWLNYEVNLDCRSAYDQLPDDFDLPSLPITPTATP